MNESSYPNGPGTGNIVEGRGDPNADIFFVGLAPGAMESARGIVFIGPSGKILNSLIRHGKINIEKCYFDNVFKKQVVEKFKPTIEHYEDWIPIIEKKIKEVNPKLIVPLGGIPLHAILGRDDISNVRGISYWSDTYNCKVLPTYHPAHLIRVWEALKFSERDFEKIEKEWNTPFIDLDTRLKKSFKSVTIKDIPSLNRLIKKIEKADLCTVDTETTGFNEERCQLLCIGFTVDGKTGYVIPLYSEFKEYWNNKELKEVHKILKKILSNKKIKYIMQNGIFDSKFLRHELKTQPYLEYDTIIMHCLLDENLPHDLNVLREFYTDIPYYEDKMREYLPNKKTPYSAIPDEILYRYCAGDVCVTHQAREVMWPLMQKEGLQDMYTSYIRDISNNVIKMSARGIWVDPVRYAETVTKISDEIAKEKRLLFAEVGYEFNPGSTQQLAKVLFEDLGLTPVKKTKTGYSTDKHVMKILAKEHPIPLRITKIKKLTKYKGTYLDGTKGKEKEKGLEPHIRKDNKVHPDLMLHRTVTGRWACRDPNMQNVPRESILRSMFAAEPGRKLIIADYASAETWAAAFYSSDRNLIRDLETGDPHWEVTKAIFKDAADRKNKHQRVIAKQVNFGILYGRGPDSLKEDLGITRTEAVTYIRKYLNRYRELDAWIKSTRAFAERREYLRNIFGRIRRFYGLKLVKDHNRYVYLELLRKAQNFPIQSTVAEYISMAINDLIKVYEERKLDAYVILQVHDEIHTDCHEDIAEEVAVLVKETMEVSRKGLLIPAEVEIKNRWVEDDEISDAYLFTESEE